MIKRGARQGTPLFTTRRKGLGAPNRRGSGDRSTLVVVHKR